MKFEVGDEVLILATHEEGKVVGLLPDNMLLVEVDGVQFPVAESQLDFPYFYRFSKKKTDVPKPKIYADQLPKEKSFQKEIVMPGVWFTFIPQFNLYEEEVELFKLYLFNQTSETYSFSYQQKFFGIPHFELLQHSLLPLSEFYLHNLSIEDWNDSPSFHFTFSLQPPQKHKVAEYSTSLKPTAKQLFRKIEDMKQKNFPFFSYLLFETFPAQQAPLPFHEPPIKKYIYEASKAKQNLPEPKEVVDLHIEQLMKDWKHLKNFEILHVQLQEFEKWYQIAVANRLPKLTIIHGVGSGKLKDEIHQLLKYKKEVKYFVNQYHSKYGFGATEIWFQY